LNSARRSISRKRILVVDDNLDAVHSMAFLLRDMGHEVHFAINGLAAIDVARAVRPDLILLDITLPDFSGNQIAMQLKWEPGLEKSRMIALSGSTDPEARQRALAAGCEDYFVKPLDISVLERLLEKS
jgi:CheY-like chemotaxis protein